MEYRPRCEHPPGQRADHAVAGALALVLAAASAVGTVAGIIEAFLTGGGSVAASVVLVGVSLLITALSCVAAKYHLRCAAGRQGRKRRGPRRRAASVLS